MSEPDDDRAQRWEGHRYDAPETDESRISKEWVYAVLGILVLLLIALIATGKVQVFGA